MSGKTTLKGNIFRALSANFIVAIVGFLGSFIFPRILTINDYALYHTFTLYLSYITILHLGFPSGMALDEGLPRGQRLCDLAVPHHDEPVRRLRAA